MCQYEKCTDEELLTRLRSGEEEISDYLMEKYKGFVRQKARAMFICQKAKTHLLWIKKERLSKS